MPIHSLDHYTIVTADLDAARDFYVKVLGLHEGARPPFDVAGAWLYSEERAIVHLVAGGSKAGDGTGPLDHVAFHATDLAGFVGRLREAGVRYTVQTVPGLGLSQVFVEDPDGIKVEVNFAAGEAAVEPG